MRKIETKDEKLAQFQAMLRADPENVSLWRSCVELAQRSGDYATLRELADQRLELQPYDAEARYQKVTAMIGEKAYQAAIDELLELHALLPDDLAVNQNLGLCYYALSQHADAYPYLVKCYESGVRMPDLLRLLVSCCHHIGKLDEGLAIAGENRQPAATNADLAGVYALLFLDGDDPVNAARYSAYALKGDPDSIDGLVVDATLKLARLDTEGANRQFNTALKIAPNTGRAWVGLGTLALLAQDFDEAKRQLRQGLECMPGHVGSWHVLAWTELVTGNLDEAQGIFEHALEMDRNFSETHGGLAAIAALKGEADAAKQNIEIADRLDPACLSARYAEAVLHGHAGEPDAARSLLLTTVAGLAPDNGGKLSELLRTLTRH